MKVLVVGSGGREHAIVTSVAKSKRVDKIYCAPGNAGIASIAECVPIGAMEFDKLVAFAKEAIDCKIFNHPHHGIGIRNINGGVEFLNFNNMKDPISLHKRGISIIPSNNESKNRCILFLTITDYLAYKALVNLPVIFYDDNCDCFILNNHKNLGYFLVESEDYNIIDMFLPNTETGKTLTKTILDRNAAARDWAYTYKDYTSLQTFLQSYIKENKI